MSSLSATPAAHPPLSAPPAVRDRLRPLRGVLAAALLVTLAACAPAGPIPVDVPPGIGAGDDPLPLGVSPECAASFPGLAGTGELADAADIVPADWPAPPMGAQLCVVLVPNDVNAILQYVSPRQDPGAVLDYYEVMLQEYAYAGWEFERGDGIGGQPILNVRGPELEFAIQTDAGTSTFVVGFERLTP